MYKQISNDFYIHHCCCICKPQYTASYFFSNYIVMFHSFSYTCKKLWHNYMGQIEEMWAVVRAFHLGVSIHDRPMMITWELRRHMAQCHKTDETQCKKCATFPTPRKVGDKSIPGRRSIYVWTLDSREVFPLCTTSPCIQNPVPGMDRNHLWVS